MTAIDTLPTTRGRGRPRTEHPLSNAERQRRYRERQKSAEKPENTQTLQRLSQLQERVDRLESRQQEYFTRLEKRQSELEHRLKSLQTLLTRVVQRMDGGQSIGSSYPPSRASGDKSASRKKMVDAAVAEAFAQEIESVSRPPVSISLLPPPVPDETELAVTAPVKASSLESKPTQYHLNAGNRCQIATGRDGNRCSGKLSHTVKLKLDDGTLGEFGVCQIHFRQSLQQRILTPCTQEESPTST